MKTTLDSSALAEIAARLEPDHQEHARAYPGDHGGWQPVHTVYGGAQLFRAESAAKMGRMALAAMDEYAPDAGHFAEAFGVPETVYSRVREKLLREPVEDQRIDFEDGYGNRPDEEEDQHAVAAAKELVAGRSAGTLARGIGIRIKPLAEETQRRALRTLDLVVSRLGGNLPPGFVVSLPKVSYAEQVEALADALEQLEMALGLGDGLLKLEIMVETPQAIMDRDGRCPLTRLVEAGRGRCVAAHFGAYDYTAALGITASHQRMDHPACEFARSMMQAALAGSGVCLSDGAFNVLPIAVHRGSALTVAQQAENRAIVHRAWQLHVRQIRRALENGFYQGWDLHPAQIPARYAAVYAFFEEGLKTAAERLRNFVDQAARATLVRDVFDDAATGQGLLNYFLRALRCGALTEAEAEEQTGLSADELRTKSFAEILKRRHLLADSKGAG